MAAIESRSGNLTMEKLDEDVTICCICTEVYTDPKVLPCIHTFCMKCLRETGLKRNKGPGDEMPCPICRLKFKIPTEGFHGLPKNFFMERLIGLHVSQVSDPSAVTKVICSLCLEESQEQEGKEAPSADTYCIDCKYKLCDECSSEHRKFKATKNHKLIPIDVHNVDQTVMTDLDSKVCEVHEQHFLNVYCADCKTVLCAICFIEEHKNHEGSHVNKCVDGFRQQIENSTRAMNECISQAQIKRTELAKVKEEMQRRVESLECDLEKRKDEIKQITDKDACTLLQILCSERQSRLKEIQMATDDIDAYLSNLESYNSYCLRIIDKGSVSDICLAVSDLSVRSMELQQLCQPIIERGIQEFKFCFRQSELEEFLEEDRGNLVGKIEDEGDSTPKKRSKQSLLAEQSNEIHLLRKEIEIERTEKESLMLENEQLRISVAKNVQINKTLTEKLSNAEANYGAHIARLKQELDKNKIANNELQANNHELKQELDTEKTNIISLETTIKTLEINAEKLRKELDTTKTGDPILVQTIRTKAAVEEKKGISGMTILDKELFVLSAESSEVEVYDSVRFSFSRRWNLKELFGPLDIGSCSRNKCLYIFDCKRFEKSIFRVDPNEKLIKNWSTGDTYGYGHLSVTDESNVIFTAHVINKLYEYSPDGQLIRQINFSPNASIRHPFHAIKLTSGHFVVSYGASGDDLHRVCMVDVDGRLKRSFGGKRGSTIRQLSEPNYLSVDGNGFVMVSDRMNCRVLLLDSDLEYKKEILSKEKHGLRNPTYNLLDESNGRLFVADNEYRNQRILIFEFK